MSTPSLALIYVPSYAIEMKKEKNYCQLRKKTTKKIKK